MTKPFYNIKDVVVYTLKSTLKNRNTMKSSLKAANDSVGVKKEGSTRRTSQSNKSSNRVISMAGVVGDTLKEKQVCLVFKFNIFKVFL